jgi:hypothetical protein
MQCTMTTNAADDAEVTEPTEADGEDTCTMSTDEELKLPTMRNAVNAYAAFVVVKSVMQICKCKT